MTAADNVIAQAIALDVFAQDLFGDKVSHKAETFYNSDATTHELNRRDADRISAVTFSLFELILRLHRLAFGSHKHE
jgi:hypothetical protein